MEGRQPAHRPRLVEPPRRSWAGKPRTAALLTRAEAEQAAQLADQTSIGEAAHQLGMHRNTLTNTWERLGILPAWRKRSA